MAHAHESLFDGVFDTVLPAVAGWFVIVSGNWIGKVVARMKESRFDAIAVTSAVMVFFLYCASKGTEGEPSHPLPLKTVVSLAILLGIPALYAALTGRLRSQLTDAERANDDRKTRESSRDDW